MTDLTESTLEKRVAVQEAIEEVRRVYQDYTRAMDSGNLDAAMENFAEDAEIENSLWGKWRGKRSIREEFYEPVSDKITSSMHAPSSVTVVVKALDPSPDGPGEADAFSNLMNFFNFRLDSGDVVGALLTANYDMNLVREKGRWRIRRFVVKVLHMVATKDFPFPAWHVSEELAGKKV